MERLLLAGPSADGLARARQAAAAARLPAAEVAEATGAAADVLERARVFRPTLTVYAAGAADGTLARDPGALRLAAGAAGAVLVLRRGPAWPASRVLLPLTTAEVRAGTLAPAAARVMALLPGAALEVLHAGRDADEWYEARDRLQEQIAGSRTPIALGSCMRFGAPVVRRTLRALSAAAPDLVVLTRPPAETRLRRTRAAADWLQLAAGCRSSLLVLPRPAGVPPRPPAPAGQGSPGSTRGRLRAA